MKRLILLFSASLVLMVGTTGCETAARPRVVRLMLTLRSAGWHLSVNNTGERPDVSSKELTNSLARLSLRHSDLILLGSPPSRERGPRAEAWVWLARYCESNRVAVYLYGPDGSPAAAAMYSIPVYHWVAPFDYPMNLADASFFHEGQFLGSGLPGLEKVLAEISRSPPRKVLILGSLYDINSSLPPNPTPYGKQRDRVKAVLKASGTTLLIMDILPGW